LRDPFQVELYPAIKHMCAPARTSMNILPGSRGESKELMTTYTNFIALLNLVREV
jgi:hypothetical protein